MKPETAHSALRGLTPPVAAAGVLAMLMISSALAGDSRSCQGDFVLLSMEQAALYRGTQMVAGCTGTANRPECSGTSALCSWYSAENCPDFAVTYPSQAVRYCTGWDPDVSGPGTCNWNGLKRCYTRSQCAVHPEGYCYHPMVGYLNVVNMNDDFCNTSEPYTPPQPNP
jgi:hypothetical protein